MSDGEEAWFRGDTEDYGAIILDLGLPGWTGFRAQAVAGKRTRAPVLILTARSWAEQVDGIDAGADDYLRSRSEWKSCWRGCVRSFVVRGHAPRVVASGILLDERQMKVRLRGLPNALSPLEYRLVAYDTHRGRVVSQHELDGNVYGRRGARFNALEA